MDKEYLLDGEHVVMQSDDGMVVFTNLRFRYSYSKFGKADIVGMLLEKISSVEIHYRSMTFLIMLGSILFLLGVMVGVVEHELSYVLLGAVGGGLLILLYFLSRKHFITICSDGGSKIHFYTRGMNSDRVLEFVNKLEEAIKARREELK